MKKFYLLLTFLILILCTYSFKPVFIEICNQKDLIFSDVEYSFYCLQVSENISKNNVLNIGNGYIVKSNAANAKYVKSNVSNILGESIKFNSTFNNLKKIINLYEITIIKEENIESIYSLYGISNKTNFANSINVDGEKINIQIAFNKGTFVIGTPVILGDY